MRGRCHAEHVQRWGPGAIESRFRVLQPDSPRQWGKMNAAQMLAHCAVALETPLGDRHEKQALLGRLIAPFVRSSIFGDAPLRRTRPPTRLASSSTSAISSRSSAPPRQVSADSATVDPRLRTSESIASSAGLAGQEWGRFVYKHLDHHLRQFGG